MQKRGDLPLGVVGETKAAMKAQCFQGWPKSTFFFFFWRENVKRVFDCHWGRKVAGQEVQERDGCACLGRLESATDLTGRVRVG